MYSLTTKYYYYGSTVNWVEIWR